MAEIAYTRKYRPNNLKDYLGEETKTKIMSRFKDEKNYPQTVLLYGTRGAGKTTLARLITKTYQCENPQNGCACGVCSSCLAIDEELIDAEFGAKTLGVTEVNVGTDGGKQDVENMIDEMLQQPFGTKYNVFILDECHMLTKNAQNALLKVLEEPPSYLVIILATTDPEKLLGTIRDRCQLRIQMKPATTDDLVKRMTYVCQQEKIQVSTEALKLIAQLCKRNPRDCLMTLENVAKNYDHVVNIKNVMAERGALETEIYARFINGANSREPIPDTLKFLDDFDEKGITYKNFIEGLTEFIIDCTKVKYGIGIEEMTEELAKAAQKLFKSYTTEELDCILQIIEYANNQISNNESMGRLTILTTAMRISKTKLLSIGLQHVESDTVAETARGATLAAEIHKQELNRPEARSVTVDDALLTSALGRSVKEITAGPNIALVDDDSDDTESKNDVPEEDILSMFGYSEDES